MKVVRYTFDVCLRNSANKDVYSMAAELEKALAKADYVCGVEVKDSHTFKSNMCDVDAFIRAQNAGAGKVGAA